MKDFNPKMIMVACNARGLTQSDLAGKILMDAGTLSKICNGALRIKKEILQSISTVLNFPIEFFSEEINVLSPNMAHYRKRKTLNLRDRIFVESNIFIKKHIIKKLLSSVSVETNIFDLSPWDCGSPETCAHVLRSRWNVPAGAVDSMVELLESKGIIVMYNEKNDEKFSGEALPDENGVHIIYINKEHPIDRQRFTMAHELGHIIMHSFDYIPFTEEQAEDEADRFAQEFLMPELEIAPYLRDISIHTASQLKAHWKCSMQAIIMRAYKLKLIDHQKYTSLFVQLSQRGYRKREPDFGIKPEIPKLIYSLFDIHIQQLEYSDEDFAQLFSLSVDEVRRIRQFYHPSLLKIA